MIKNSKDTLYIFRHQRHVNNHALKYAMTTHNSEIYFYHGWGFNRDIWKYWKKYTEQMNCYFHDRGYCNEPNDIRANDMYPGFNGGILVAHSFGLHLIPSEIMNRVKLCIIFGGFINLVSDTGALNIKSNTIMNHMNQKFIMNAPSVLSAFYKNVFFPEIPDTDLLRSMSGFDGDTLNKNLMLEDLYRMQHEFLDLKNLIRIPETIIFHGKKDRIVPVEKGIELHKALPNSKIHIFEKSGHALPFIMTEEIWSLINETVHMKRAFKS